VTIDGWNNVGGLIYVNTTIHNFPANVSVTIYCTDSGGFAFPHYGGQSTGSGTRNFSKGQGSAVCSQTAGIATRVNVDYGGQTYTSNPNQF
jgi:hypothetical protein